MQSRDSRGRLWLVVGIGVLAIWGVIMAAPAWAEWTFDVYAGMPFLPDGDVESNGTNENVSFDDSFTVGGRLGYWFGFFPYLGVAIDVSYYTSDLEFDTVGQVLGSADLKRIPVSGLAMLRLPLLPSPAVPRGHLEPYVAAGPTLFLSELSLDDDDLREDVGVDVRAGLNVRLTRGIGIFAEYRLTYVEQEFTFTRQGVRSVVEADPSTHHIQGGVSLRF